MTSCMKQPKGNIATTSLEGGFTEKVFSLHPLRFRKSDLMWLPVRLPLPSSRRRHLAGPQTNFRVSSRMARESKTLVPTSGSTTTPSSISHLDLDSYGTMSLNAERPMVRLSCCTPSNELAGGPNPTERHGKTQDQDPSQLNPQSLGHHWASGNAM